LESKHIEEFPACLKRFFVVSDNQIKIPRINLSLLSSQQGNTASAVNVVLR